MPQVENSIYEPVAKSTGLDMKEFIDTLISNKTSFDFIDTGSKTKEGPEYWKSICEDFAKKYQNKSVKVFIKEAYGRVPVAKLVNANASEEPRFISVLKDTGISFDYVESEEQNLVAYKNLYKIEEEWI